MILENDLEKAFVLFENRGGINAQKLDDSGPYNHYSNKQNNKNLFTFINLYKPLQSFQNHLLKHLQ